MELTNYLLLVAVVILFAIWGELRLQRKQRERHYEMTKNANGPVR